MGASVSSVTDSRLSPSDLVLGASEDSVSVSTATSINSQHSPAGPGLVAARALRKKDYPRHCRHLYGRQPSPSARSPRAVSPSRANEEFERPLTDRHVRRHRSMLEIDAI